MIAVDYNRGSIELKPDIERLGVRAERSSLTYGDFAFDGNGPDGPISIGIERKSLHDMLTCIDDNRYNQQRMGMKNMYTISVLNIEGWWRPHDNQGFLMEGFSGGLTWGYCKPGSQRVLYAKIYRYLISVQLSGVLLSYSYNPFHTACNVVEWFHYFEKRWDSHTALRALPKVQVPTLNARPNLLRKWAFALDGIGDKHSEEAARLFKTPINLALSDEAEWLKIPGVGIKSAQQIVREINGYKR